MIAVAGRYVAYDRYFDDGGLGDQLFTVAVRDGFTMRLVLASHRGKIGSARARVRHIVVDRRGHAAWLWEAQHDGDSSLTREITRSGGCGPRVLDSGPQIDPSTLRLSGGNLSWLSSGLLRTQALCPRLQLNRRFADHDPPV